MESNENKDKRGRAEWVEIVEAQERSGESAASFCRKQGINYNHFWYRRRTINISVTKDQQAQEPSVSRALSLTKSRAFIPVRLGESGSIRLRFPTGLILESDRIPPAEWVVDIATAWGSREAEPC